MDWYDAHWWRCWAAARAWLTSERPDEVARFDELVESLRPTSSLSAQLLPDGVPDDLLTAMQDVAATMEPVRLESHELATFGRHVVHDAFPPDVVARGREVLEAIVGVDLVPSYDFLSRYHDTGVCTPHVDAPNAGFTLDVCLDQSGPWPLLVRGDAPWPPDGGVVTPPPLEDDGWTELTMQVPGDAVVFAGTSVWHGRRPMPDPDGHCTLGFLHYVPRGTQDVVRPTRWAELLEVPALADVVRGVV